MGHLRIRQTSRTSRHYQSPPSSIRKSHSPVGPGTVSTSRLTTSRTKPPARALAAPTNVSDSYWTSSPSTARIRTHVGVVGGALQCGMLKLLARGINRALNHSV